MCGIHGFIDKSSDEHSSQSCIQKMVRSTGHRGPDYSGIQKITGGYLGHNRLSIIDLHEEANQPMQRSGHWIVFNGEIYNFKEIRSELAQSGYHCTTQSDTEVILQSYFAWGSACVLKFVGMWAFAIFDEKTETLFCSRDRFGIKPFYYIADSGRFYFASEVKALRNTPIFTNELNMDQIKKFVQLSYTSFLDDSMYKAVKLLEPATNLVWRDGKIELFKYWQLNQQKNSLEDSHAIESFRTLFTDALRLHVRSDVPVGATLSGGIDSSAIVSTVLSEQILGNIDSFSVYYDGKDEIDERPFVNEVVSKYQQRIRPNFISPKVLSVRENLYEITHHNDFPLLGSSLISQYFIMEAISHSGIKVILSGQGADDYLGGYMQSYYRFYADCIRSLRFGTLFHETQKQRAFQNLSFGKGMSVALKSMASLLFSEAELNKLEYKYADFNAFNNISVPKLKMPQSQNKLDDMHLAMLVYSSLPGLLHFEDRNSMAFSIESRVPFLDHRLVEFSFSLDNRFKIRDGYTKWILRESMRGILPDKIRTRKDKVGFVTPGEIKWLRTDLSDLLNTDNWSIPELDNKRVRTAVQDFLKGDNRHAKILWRLANLNFWIKNLV